MDGDKIYADVGPGWDDPVLGWHECPPGAGIWQKVYLEGRPKLAVTGLFVRPDLAAKAIEVRVEVDHRDNTNRDVDLTLSIYPKNFHGPALENIPVKAAPAGPGSTEYRSYCLPRRLSRLDAGKPHTCTPSAPRFVPRTLGLSMLPRTISACASSAWTRVPAVKGTLYLNGEPIILRGANTMGNFEVPVMKGDENS